MSAETARTAAHRPRIARAQQTEQNAPSARDREHTAKKARDNQNNISASHRKRAVNKNAQSNPNCNNTCRLTLARARQEHNASLLPAKTNKMALERLQKDNSEMTNMAQIRKMRLLGQTVSTSFCPTKHQCRTNRPFRMPTQCSRCARQHFVFVATAFSTKNSDEPCIHRNVCRVFFFWCKY